MGNNEEQGLMVRGESALAEIHRIDLDRQITTAKAYPRDVALALGEAREMVTMSKDVAQSCQYNIPRGKGIKGESIRLAEIVANAWGNLRVQASVVEINATQVVAHCACMDVQRNYGEQVEVRRSITGNRGRYNDDMITVTGQAAMSIAKRNAIFAVVPKAFVKTVYDHAISFLLDGATSLKDRRKKALEYCQDELSVGEKDVLAFLERATVGKMSMSDVEKLVSVVSAIKENETTVDAVFFPPKDEKPSGLDELKEELDKNETAEAGQTEMGEADVRG